MDLACVAALESGANILIIQSPPFLQQQYRWFLLVVSCEYIIRHVFAVLGQCLAGGH